MPDTDETQALRAEVAELRTENERLREWRAAHVCAQPNMAPLASAALPCTCGTTAGCQAHPRAWPGNVWISQQNPWANACAGGFTGQVYTVLPGESMKVNWFPTAGAAGVPPTVIYSTTAGQYP